MPKGGYSRVVVYIVCSVIRLSSKKAKKKNIEESLQNLEEAIETKLSA